MSIHSKCLHNVLVGFLIILSVVVTPSIWRQSMAAAAKNEILVGVALPMSGPMATQTVEQRWAYNRAVADINAAGGIFLKQYGKKLPVRLIYKDDEGNPVKASAAAKELITQTKVDFLLSGCTASSVLPAIIQTEKYHVYYHATAFWTTMFRGYGFRWSTTYFADVDDMKTIPFELLNKLTGPNKVKKIAQFYEDTDDGNQLSNFIGDMVVKKGYEKPLHGLLRVDLNKLTDSLMEAKKRGVDAFFTFGDADDIVALVRQMKKINYDVKFLLGYKGTRPQEFQKALGKDADRILFDGFWSMDLPFPGAKELGERYIADHGTPSYTAGMYYAVAQILWQAVEKAGTLDAQTIRKAILSSEFNTVMGKVTYDKAGVAILPLIIMQRQDGMVKIIYPFQYANAPLLPIRPWKGR
jgi:branched-chain amino acid transport system substrate-binding protein